MRISVRQICFIMLAYTVVSKILIMPTLLTAAVGRDLWFPVLLDFAVQAVVIWAVSYLCSRTDKTFYELLEGTFGKIFAKIIFGLFGLFFLFGTLVPLLEQKLYVHTIFYDTVPSLVIFLPFFIFSVYAGCKKFTNIGRCADICLPIFVISLLFILVMSLLEVKWDNVLPLLKSPVKGLFGGALSNSYRFFEPCWLLMFMGHFKYKKWDAAKITISYIGGALVVIFILLIYYGLYGGITVSRQFAISKISLFFPAMETLGRIDLTALYALEVVMLFSLVLNIQLAVYCIRKCTGWENSEALSLIVNAVLFALVIIFDSKSSAVTAFYGKWAFIPLVIFATVIPLLSWALRRRER